MTNNRNYFENNTERRTRTAHFIEDRNTHETERNAFINDNYVYPAPAPRKKSYFGMVMATIAITLVAALSVGVGVFFATQGNKNLFGTKPTVTNSQQAAAPAADGSSHGDAETATQADRGSEGSAAMAIAKSVYAGHTVEPTAEENVVLVDGERVYIDTKRLAPENTSDPAHFYANGATSYGFDWNYDTDNANFVLACHYNFAKQQYDFTFYGVTPGTSHVTLWYNTADNVQVPVHLTLNVDNDLNVTQG